MSVVKWNRRSRASTRDLSITLVLWVASVSLVLVVSHRERRQELARVDLETRITGEQVALRLQECFASRLAIVESLAAYRWESIDAIRENWALRAEVLVGLLPGVLALNYVNPQSVIEIVVPEAANVAALNSVLLENPHPSVPAAIRAARRGVPSRTAPVKLLQSGQGFATYALLTSPAGAELGYANGVFRLRPLMETCLAESSLEENYQLAFFEGDSDSAFYVKPPGASPRPWSHGHTFTIPAADRPWRMQIAPRPSAAMAADRFNERLILVLGLFLSTLAAGLAWLLLARQNALRESRERYQFLVENQSDFVVQLDDDGLLTYASPSFCRSQGRDNAELLEKPLADLVDPDSADKVAEVREALCRPPHQASVELSMQACSGTRRIAWSFSKAAGEKGPTRLTSGTGRDLTDLRLLEGRVAHADKMRAIGEMAGGVSHDFNNLLQVMLGNVELLKEESADGQREQLEQVEAALLRALSLTAKLATLSRQQKAERVPIDLSGFVKGVAGLVRRTLPATIQLQVDTPGESGEAVTVMGDPTQLEQVLLNLALNARDSIDRHGTIRIELDIETLDEARCRVMPGLTPGVYARLSVCDDGCGISAETLPRIFDPFFTTKGYGAGLGLGLSNCDTIVRDHGGAIDVRSSEGSGSTFTVVLPLVSEAPAATVPDEHPYGRAPIDAGDLILVADDNGDICKLVERILGAAGYRTLRAHNGAEAVRVFQDHRGEISLVILDLIMPVMDGHEAADRIRELSDSVQILFMSGYVPADEGVDVRGDGVLQKPFRGSELRARVDAAIGRSTPSDR
jgi:PAS domain S-box-containing protein